MYTLELTSTCTVKKGKKEKFAAEFSEREAGRGDLTIQIQDDSTQVHRAVLMESSDYFKNMFSGNFSESDVTSLNLSNVFNHVDEANAVFDFVYTGTIVLSEQNIESIVNAASLFLLPELCDACSRFLTTNLAPCTCLSIFLLAERYNLYNLHSACVEVLQSWFQFMLYAQPECFEITPHSMILLIDEGVFAYLPDDIKGTFLRKWHQHLKESTEGSVSLPQKLKDYLKPYITEIGQSGKDPQHSGDVAGAIDQQDSMDETEAENTQDSRNKTEVKGLEGTTVKAEFKGSQDLADEAEFKVPQDSDIHFLIHADNPEDFSDKHYLGNDPEVSGVEEVLYTTLKGPVAGSTRCCIEIHVFSPSLRSWKFILRHEFSEVVKDGAVPKLIDVNENKAYFVLLKDDLVDSDECVIVVDLESKKEDIIRTPKNVCTKRDRYYGNKPHYFLWSGALCGIFLGCNKVDWFIFRNEHKEKCTGSCDGQCWGKIFEFCHCKKYPFNRDQSEFLTKVVGDDLYLWVKEYKIDAHSQNVFYGMRCYLSYIVKPGKGNECSEIEPLGASKGSEVNPTASNGALDSDSSDSEISSSSDNEEDGLFETKLTRAFKRLTRAHEKETREKRKCDREWRRMTHWNHNSECKMTELRYPPDSEFDYPPNIFNDDTEWCYSSLANIYTFQGSQLAASSHAESITFIHKLDLGQNIREKTEKAWRNETVLSINTYMINEDVWVRDMSHGLPDPDPVHAILDAIAPGQPYEHKTSLPMVLPCKRLVFKEGNEYNGPVERELDEYNSPVERELDEDGFEERKYERRYSTESEDELAEEDFCSERRYSTESDKELAEEDYYGEVHFADTRGFNDSEMKRGPETCVGAIYHCITTSAYQTSVFRLKVQDMEWSLVTQLPYSLYRFPFFQLGEMSLAHFETLPNSKFEDVSGQIGQSAVAIACVKAFNKGQSSAYSNIMLNGKQYQEKLGKAWQAAFDKK